MKYIVLLFAIMFAGCGDGDSESVSSESNVDIISCGDIQCTVPVEEVGEFAEEIESNGDELQEIAEFQNNGGLDQQTRIVRFHRLSDVDYFAKNANFVCGCGNIISNETNISASDDDVTLSAGGQE